MLKIKLLFTLQQRNQAIIYSINSETTICFYFMIYDKAPSGIEIID